MSRPRSVQLKDGKVSLQGFPKEIADKLVEHIKAFELPEVIVPFEQPLKDKKLELPHVESTTVSMEDLKFLRDAQSNAKAFTDKEIIISPSVSENIILTDKAIGIRLKDKKWELVTVGYNTEAGVAKIEQVNHQSDFKGIAITEFKKKASELKFV